MERFWTSDLEEAKSLLWELKQVAMAVAMNVR